MKKRLLVFATFFLCLTVLSLANIQSIAEEEDDWPYTGGLRHVWTKIEEIYSRFDNQDVEIDALNTRLSNEESKVIALENELAELTIRVSELENSTSGSGSGITGELAETYIDAVQSEPFEFVISVSNSMGEPVPNLSEAAFGITLGHLISVINHENGDYTMVVEMSGIGQKEIGFYINNFLQEQLLTVNIARVLSYELSSVSDDILAPDGIDSETYFITCNLKDAEGVPFTGLSMSDFDFGDQNTNIVSMDSYSSGKYTFLMKVPEKVVGTSEYYLAIQPVILGVSFDIIHVTVYDPLCPFDATIIHDWVYYGVEDEYGSMLYLAENIMHAIYNKYGVELNLAMVPDDYHIIIDENAGYSVSPDSMNVIWKSQDQFSLQFTEPGSYPLLLVSTLYPDRVITGFAIQIEDSFATYKYYYDGDQDGYGVDYDFQMRQYPDEPYTALQGGDWDDGDASCYPGAPELLDGKDNDGDGVIDEGLTALTEYYADRDRDGYGYTDPVTGDSDTQFLEDPEYPYTALVGGDWDDNDVYSYPGAVEVPDGNDNDGDGLIDEEIVVGGYYDYDGDGYGFAYAYEAYDYYMDWDTMTVVMTYDPTNPTPADVVFVNGDWDDDDPDSYPGAPELLDGKDNDGDGLIDEDFLTQTYYYDFDGDGYGVDGTYITSTNPVGYYTAMQGGDFDDSDWYCYPGAPEYPDGKDNDGDGSIDEDYILDYYFYRDRDGDTYGVDHDYVIVTAYFDEGLLVIPLPLDHEYSARRGGDFDDSNPTCYIGAVELADGVDNDGDGWIDEEL